jgi:hypothetical protein
MRQCLLMDKQDPEKRLQWKAMTMFQATKMKMLSQESQKDLS